MLIASKGHLFGHEDAINQRPHTLTAIVYSD